MEPRERVELSTCRLRIGCSTTELPRLVLLTIASAENWCQFISEAEVLAFSARRGTWPSRFPSGLPLSYCLQAMKSYQLYKSGQYAPLDSLYTTRLRGRKSMFHLIWYVLIGLISGVIAKDVMHVHITIFWTVVLGIIGGIIGGAVTHMFSRPTNERYHPAGLIFSTLGAILVLFICYKLKIHFPEVNPF